MRHNKRKLEFGIFTGESQASRKYTLPLLKKQNRRGHHAFSSLDSGLPLKSPKYRDARIS